MSVNITGRGRRAVTVVAVASTLTLALAACTNPAAIAPSVTASTPSSLSPSASVSPSSPPTGAPTSPSPSASPSPTETATKISKSCLDLVSLDTMYQFDPNFGVKPGYAPKSGTKQATAVTNGGVACGWVQQTSGATLEIAVARPSPATLATLRGSSGGETFTSAGGAGELQVFTGPYWIIATSTYFGQAGDARPLIDAVTSALR